MTNEPLIYDNPPFADGVKTPLIGAEAYADFRAFSELSYNCITKLMKENELVWKLLKYPQADAWERPNLTPQEKADLVYKGVGDSSKFHVFMDGKQPDVLMEQVALLRIMPQYAVGINRTVGYVQVGMEVFAHYNINHLTNYKTRVDSITEELLSLFNGAEVGGVGLMSFSRMLDQSARLFEIGQIPFGGKHLVFSTYAA